MKTKERKISPYPILYSSKEHSGYNDSTSFNVEVSAQNNFEKGQIEINISCSLDNEELLSLIETQEAAIYVNVECSKTYFRLSQKEYSLNPQKISVPFADVSSGVEVFVGIIAERNISRFSSPSFSGIYEGEYFEIEKGQLLAADNEWEIPLEGIGDFSVPISIQKSEMKNDDFRVTHNKDILIISLNEKSYELYKNLSKRFLYSSAFIILIPAIASALRALIHEQQQSDSGEVDVLEKRWTSFIDKLMKKRFPGWNINECEIYDSSDECFLESQLRIAWGGVSLPFEKELKLSITSKEIEE